MIIYKTGNILDSTCDILTCPVNTVGVMEKGLALEFKLKYPHLEIEYKKLLKNNILKIGQIAIASPFICLFPTKEHWKDPSKLEYIEEGLKDILEYFEYMRKSSQKEPSIAFPKLGCGLGNLNWQEVKSLMEKYLAETSNKIEIYE